jgi:hypothetical protein
MKNIYSIDYVDVRLQSAVTYIYIGNMMYLFESDTIKSFLNKLNIKPYLNSICSGKIGYSGLTNRMVRFLRLWLIA